MELALWVIAAILFIRFLDEIWMAFVVLLMIALPITAIAAAAMGVAWLFTRSV